MSYLSISNLSIRLRGTPLRLLRDVSLTVKSGEVHGLVGESGAGKSMIGKAVLGGLEKTHAPPGVMGEPWGTGATSLWAAALPTPRPRKTAITMNADRIVVPPGKNDPMPILLLAGGSM